MVSLIEVILTIIVSAGLYTAVEMIVEMYHQKNKGKKKPDQEDGL